MNLLVLMTFDVSLVLWDQIGIIDRELAPYQKMSERGVGVTLVTFGCEDDLLYEKKYPFLTIVPVYKLATRPKKRILRMLFSLVIPYKYRKTFRSASVWKTNQLYGGWVLLVARFFFKKPIVVRCGYEFVSAAQDTGAGRLRLVMMRQYSRMMYRFAAHIIVASKRMSDLVQADYGADSEKITIIGNGIDLMQFSKQPSDSGNRVLFVGRLEPIKNIPLILKAAAVAQVPCDIVGEGSLRNELEALAEHLSLDCRFLGKIENFELPAKYSEALVLILGSISEWSPKVVLEAMACQCPVVGVNSPGINELIVHEQTGFLVEPTSSAVADAICRVQTEKILIDEICTNGRRFVEEHHNHEANASNECSVYRRVSSAFV